MMTETSQAAGLQPIEASLQYLANDKDLAIYLAPTAGGEVKPHEGNYVMQSVPVESGRGRAEGFSLDREGFTLLRQITAVKDFYDDEEITSTYEAEVKALVSDATGASRVEIFDHTRRTTDDDMRKSLKVREPASIIHNDYSAESGIQRLRDHFPDAPEEAEALLKHRFAIVNVWRSIRGQVRRGHLALCDASSVAPQDLVSVKRQAKDRIGEIQLATYNPNHRWYFFPAMGMDEALLIKTFDSAADGRARFTIHTSFEGPDVAKDTPARESLETRCFVFFD